MTATTSPAIYSDSPVTAEIPRTMRAAILVEQHQELVVDTVDLPRQLDFGQVLVKVAVSGICGSQLGEIDGAKGPDKFLPHLLGHEGAGQVVQVGPGVRHVQVGQTVVMHWMKGAGHESDPPKYRWRGKLLNAGWVTSFNEYAVVSENRVTAISPDIDLECAALFGCAVTTGLGVVTNDAKVKIGESVVIMGAGGIGQSVVQGARLASAYPIIAVDRVAAKLELTRQLGATHTIDTNTQSPADEIRKIIGTSGADVIVDTTGVIPLIEMGYQLSHVRGRVVLVGVPGAGENISIHSLPLHFGKTITGSHGGSTEPSVDIPRYARMAQAGQLDLSQLVTDRFSLNEINTAISAVRTGKAIGRCVINMAPNPGG